MRGFITDASGVAETADLAAILPTGRRASMPGSSGEILSLVQALCGEGAPGLDVTTRFVPGINASPLGTLPDGMVSARTAAVVRDSVLRERRRFAPQDSESCASSPV